MMMTEFTQENIMYIPPVVHTLHEEAALTDSDTSLTTDQIEAYETFMMTEPQENIIYMPLPIVNMHMLNQFTNEEIEALEADWRKTIGKFITS